MSELPWLSKYSGQSTRELIAMEHAYRKDSLVLVFEEALGQKAFRLGEVSLLSNEERIVLAIEALEREVNNGGYSQFLQNTEAELVTSVVAALNSIGCVDLAKLTQRAIDVVGPREKSPDGDLGETAMAALEDCDAEYFEIAGDLADPLLQFIKQAEQNIALP